MAVRSNPSEGSRLLTTVLEELKCIKADLGNIKEEQQRMNALLIEQQNKTFSIVGSRYQAELTMELSRHFCLSLERDISAHKIGQIIVKVLRDGAKSRHKFEVAKAYIKSKMTDFRCEERRRVFGLKPCDHFKKMTTKEFALKFLHTIKAPADAVLKEYTKNLALLRKYCREGDSASVDTYKGYRAWLGQKYKDGKPSEQEICNIVAEDIEHYEPAPDTLAEIYLQEDNILSQ